MRVYFNKHSFEVVTARTGVEAKRLVEEVPFSLVILDIMLAESDGIAILSELKEAYPQLPIVIMTGIGFDEKLLSQALLNGAAAYVSKTLPLDQLLIEIKRVLDH